MICFFFPLNALNDNTDRWSDRTGLLLTQEVRKGMCEFIYDLTPTGHSSPWRLHFHSDFGPLARALKSGLRPVVRQRQVAAIKNKRSETIKTRMPDLKDGLNILRRC